jgi:2,4-dienoyl-CoA reductase-like NADH-dependent reductase (Old Yellow Enzyme family)
MMEYEALLQPIKLGKLEARNRVVMPPMVLNAAKEDGSVSEKLLISYKNRAEGVGLVIVESTNVMRGGEIASHQLQIHDNKFIDGLGKLATAIASKQSKSLIQINHGGAKAFPLFAGQTFLSASTIPISHGQIPRSMTVGEIEHVVLAFADAAERAVLAGFDGVEVQACHFYLLSQFLSRYSNKREDEYGGDLLGRTKFLRQVVEGIRRRVGDDPILCCRINGIESIENGLSVQDAGQIGRMLESAGADVLHVSGVKRTMQVNFEGKTFTRLVAALTDEDAPGSFVDAASQIKQGVSIPVIVAGKIFTPSLGESILQKGKADMIAFGRQMLVNNRFGRYLYEGRVNELKQCTECYNCLKCLVEGMIVECPLNPELFE